MHNFYNKVRALLMPTIVVLGFTTCIPLAASMDNVRRHHKKMVNVEQVKCLATNIFYEARMEPLAGQAAVARVVVNRVKHGFASTPCKVIYQSNYFNRGNDMKVKVCQFSWVCEKLGKPKENDPRFKQAMQIAYDVLAHDKYKEVVPKSTLFFHATHVSPEWKYKKVKKIGNHIFYSK